MEARPDRGVDSQSVLSVTVDVSIVGRCAFNVGLSAILQMWQCCCCQRRFERLAALCLHRPADGVRRSGCAISNFKEDTVYYASDAI